MRLADRLPSAAFCAAGIEVLDAVEAGTLTAEIDGPTWGEVYAGNVVWRLSNGWRVRVFNDCDEWDYVDAMMPPPGEWQDEPNHGGWVDLWPVDVDVNGRAWKRWSDAFEKRCGRLRDWEPRDESRWPTMDEEPHPNWDLPDDDAPGDAGGR